MASVCSGLIDDRMYVLRTRWENYVAHGTFELFIEFTVAVNSLAENFNRMRLPGLVRLCEGLENLALSCLGDTASHPVSPQHISALQRQLDTLLGAVSSARTALPERRSEELKPDALEGEWIKPRSVWLVAATDAKEIVDALTRQLNFFGFRTHSMDWGGNFPQADIPLAVLFIPHATVLQETEHSTITALRTHCATSQLVYLGASPNIASIVSLMRSGIDTTIPQENVSSNVLNCVLDLVQKHHAETYRVLVVEDSKVALTLIQRTLSEHSIDSHAIRNPEPLLEVINAYRPDLILMDMHMPGFNGTEATRVLRQMSAYKSMPIVYLSGESDTAMQVEALRLGGDQFLIKPFNPVLLAAVVKTKIERYRETLRSSQIDGLTGLLNHTSIKSQLKILMEENNLPKALTVAMIDIDHFKSVNDTYGHPVGDQVIRGLAWLLKGRLRASDLIGRYGGEEFLIALPDTDPKQARNVIEHIRKDFATQPHTHSSGVVYATFSAGIASWPEFENAKKLTESADKALLLAKRRGRNRVEKATPEADYLCV